MRKPFAALIVVVLSAALASGCNIATKSTPEKTLTEAGNAQTYSRTEVITSGEEAKKLLEQGNTRFSSNKPASKNIGRSRREELKSNGQHPFAVVLSCSDSRVPPEVIFDQALGDLFEVRVAGNVVDAVDLGSVEYAVEHLKTPLIVVMGHEKCGAVTAAVEGGEAPGSIGLIVSKIKPSVDKAKALGVKGEQLVEKTTELNVEASIAELEKSPMIKELVEAKRVKIIGAKYHLGTGQVQWLDEK